MRWLEVSFFIRNPLRGGSIFFLLVFLFLALMSTVFYSSMDGFYRSSGGYQLLNQPDFLLPYRRMIDGSRIKGSSWYGCRSARCPVCLYEPNKQAYGMGTQSTRAKAIYEEWRSQALSTNISKQSVDKPNLENQASDSQATISLWSNRNRIEL